MPGRKLVRALQKRFDMLAEDAKRVAEVVESVFQGEDEVNDEDLDKDVRSLFYSLEREKLLAIRRTEYKFEGQMRRAYFWTLADLDAREPELVPARRDESEHLELLRVYRAIPPEAWDRKPRAAG